MATGGAPELLDLALRRLVDRDDVLAAQVHVLVVGRLRRQTFDLELAPGVPGVLEGDVRALVQNHLGTVLAEAEDLELGSFAAHHRLHLGSREATRGAGCATKMPVGQALQFQGLAVAAPPRELDALAGHDLIDEPDDPRSPVGSFDSRPLAQVHEDRQVPVDVLELGPTDVVRVGVDLARRELGAVGAQDVIRAGQSLEALDEPRREVQLLEFARVRSRAEFGVDLPLLRTNHEGLVLTAFRAQARLGVFRRLVPRLAAEILLVAAGRHSAAVLLAAAVLVHDTRPQHCDLRGVGSASAGEEPRVS